MTRRSVLGIFDNEAQAREAHDALVAAGIHEGDIAISADLAHDDIAAEAPGQSYENQPGQRPAKWFGSRVGRNASLRPPDMQYAQTMHAGGCVVAVEVNSADELRRVAGIMGGLRAASVRQC